MFKQDVTSIFILFVVLQSPLGSNGEQNTLCYIRKNNEHTKLCFSPKIVMCCSQRITVNRIDVYGNSACGTVSKCQSSDGCCQSRNILNVSADYIASLKRRFRNTHCFNDVMRARQLPNNTQLVSVVVSYSCIVNSTSTTATSSTSLAGTTTDTPITTPSTTATEATTITNSDASATRSYTSGDSKTNETDSNTNVAAAVAIPVVIVFLIAGVVAVVFLIRRRRATNKKTHQSGVEPNTLSINGPLQKSSLDYRQHAALPPSYDEDINSEYAEIEGNRNSNLFGESNEYNTISPRHLPVANSRILAGKRATNEDYDLIGKQSPAHSNGTNTYAHIDHSAANRLNVSNGGVVTDTSMYAHTAHNAKPRNGANTVDVGGDTYAHVDHSGKQSQAENSRFNEGDTYAHANHGALQEHVGNGNSNTYDSTSTSGVRQEGGRYVSEESQYDHTGQNAPRCGFGQFQDGGVYSHVGSLSASRQREDDRTVTNGDQNQSLVNGTKKQNDLNSDQHNYFVLEKQFK